MREVPIDLSIQNVWDSWFAFRRGKRPTHELESFCYNLETQLWELYQDLYNGTYRHGQYHTFTVFENKQRTISVAGVRDRVVHRLLYQYLVNLYDKTFYFDVWSCRKNKGLVGAIERTQSFLNAYPKSFIWRADITKFFDHVNHDTLLVLLTRKINDPTALRILEEVISSHPKIGQYDRERE
jgi:RNA-directed DNA polymerase